MKNISYYKFSGEKLATRTARRAGQGAAIQIPVECIGRRYERYIDRKTGVITIVPVENQPAEPREEEST